MNADLLLRLRLLVARYGEMDLAQWWNTQGLLGGLGRSVFARGFPRTHFFAQARLVLTVAAARSRDVFNPPNCITLWNLPAELEEQFEDSWHGWIESGAEWTKFFEKLAAVSAAEPFDQVIQGFGLADKSVLESVRKLRRSAEGRAVALPGVHEVSDRTLTQLAAAFCHGEKMHPAIPYARTEGH